MSSSPPELSVTRITCRWASLIMSYGTDATENKTSSEEPILNMVCLVGGYTAATVPGTIE